MRYQAKMKKVAGTPEQVEAIYGIAQGTLANLRWAKKGPRYFRKPGGGRRIYYLLAEVESWLTSEPTQTLDSDEDA